MRKYYIDKFKGGIFLGALVVFIFIVFTVLMLTGTRLLTAILFSAVFLWPFALIIVQFINCYKNYVSVGSQHLIYKEKGITEKEISWNDISNIQYRGCKFIPCTNTMVIHFKNTIWGINKKYIFFDYLYKDYKKLWKEILTTYSQQNEDAEIDPKFKKIIEKL